MPQRVADEGSLAVVEPFYSPQFFFGLFQSTRLTLYMLVERLDGPLDYIELKQDEVGQIVVVGLRVEKGAAIAACRLSENLGDGNEREESVFVPEHRPIE